MLTAWAGGPAAERLAGTSDRELLGLAIESLAAGLGLGHEEVRRRMREHWWHDWGADRFARGAYSYVGVGGTRAHEVLSRPVERTLFFAGEATCGDGLNATMEGALRSGRRAAAPGCSRIEHPALFRAEQRIHLAGGLRRDGVVAGLGLLPDLLHLVALAGQQRIEPRLLRRREPQLPHEARGGIQRRPAPVGRAAAMARVGRPGLGRPMVERPVETERDDAPGDRRGEEQEQGGPARAHRYLRQTVERMVKVAGGLG